MHSIVALVALFSFFLPAIGFADDAAPAAAVDPDAEFQELRERFIGRMVRAAKLDRELPELEWGARWYRDD